VKEGRRHRGADQWLFVTEGTGNAIVLMRFSVASSEMISP
jgi:hypothetical protein